MVGVSGGYWTQIGLSFFPFFLSMGLLITTGIILIRLYHDEIKQKPIIYTNVLNKSWEVAVGASYYFIPVVLVYFVIWIFLGIFFLLKEIPGIGQTLGLILGFAPFILNLILILLCVLSVITLFFATPQIALRRLSGVHLGNVIYKQIRNDLFTNCFLFFVAAIPFLITFYLLHLATNLSAFYSSECESIICRTLEAFFIMIPFTAFLVPSTIFFFNFSAEAHILIQKNAKLYSGDMNESSV